MAASTTSHANLCIVSRPPELASTLLQESRWNYLFAFLALPALLQLSVLPFLPESPRFLLMERRDEAGAERASSLLSISRKRGLSGRKGSTLSCSNAGNARKANSATAALRTYCCRLFQLHHHPSIHLRASVEGI
ncbi:solute carrier family 2, facilitated glucose transporter member 9 isoform X1 [Lates japonicus]|uniref:Solute carrier family 2, facilitated glucose transporter member 9 isoform X1 n=1 Tax=Lates japonicus TaxID=270547 RepID=A0AAD3NHP8_LATJO|nr:solute carrier family 2, facilitated glucose transporter member 9 isoform X1 [Lates japonicus]